MVMLVADGRNNRGFVRLYQDSDTRLAVERCLNLEYREGFSCVVVRDVDPLLFEKGASL